MKTKQTIVAVALSSIALSFSVAASAGNPERDSIDETLGTSVAAGGNDGWKDFGAERVAYVGGGAVSEGGGHVYTKEEMLQARMDYREAGN